MTRAIRPSHYINLRNPGADAWNNHHMAKSLLARPDAITVTCALGWPEPCKSARETR